MEGSTTAPARLLTDFVGTLPDEDLEMTLDGATQSLSLRCARFDTHIKCIEAEEFPPGPRPDEGDRLRGAAGRADQGGRADPDGGVDRRGPAGPDRRAGPGAGRAT